MNFCIIIIAGMVSCGPAKKEEVQETATELEETVQEEVAKVAAKEATAVISSANESGLTGVATFVDKGEGLVEFTINIENTTSGEHAVHLHQNGDRSAPDATSAGGHSNLIHYSMTKQSIVQGPIQN